MTVYQILQLWRELVLPIYSLSLEYIDYAGVAMCAEWKMVSFRRTSCMYGQLPSVSRPVGRPILRYKDVLKRDLKELNINTEN